MADPIKLGDVVVRIDPSSRNHGMRGEIDNIDLCTRRARVEWQNVNGGRRITWISLDAEGKRWRRG